ncbi:MAG: hypothetical protein UF068_04990, partial [Slackia isoflavoniconvertens]|nr:hypothetical protein [Slackia isoflavoniconvertens]
QTVEMPDVSFASPKGEANETSIPIVQRTRKAPRFPRSLDGFGSAGRRGPIWHARFLNFS